MARLQGISFVSIVLYVRHLPTAVDNTTREHIPQQQLGQVIITVFISTLRLHSQAGQCIGWATIGLTIPSLSSVFGVMRHVRRRCLLSVEVRVVVLDNIMVLL